MTVEARRVPGRVRGIEIVTESRPPIARTVGVAGAAAGAGMLAEYLLDPARGRARRVRLRDKTVRAAHRLTNGARVLARDAGGRGQGILAGTRYRIAGRRVSDDVLHERVRAELGRYVGHPHAVEVHVVDGDVRLTGDVLAGEAKRAARAVLRVPGVRRLDLDWIAHTDTTGVPNLQGGSRPRRPRPEPLQRRWSPTMRFLAGSAAASGWAAAHRLPGGLRWTLRVPAAVLGARVVTNLPLRRLTGVGAGRRAVDVSAGIYVDAPPERLWSLLSDYDRFPEFMPDVREVRRSADGRLSHWVIRGPAGAPVRFDAEETKREEGRELAWRTTDGQLVAHTGCIRLAPEGNGRTHVHVRLSYNPLTGAAGHAVATLLGADPRHRLHTDLQHLKDLAETR